jgi:hypothetical protein
MHMRDVAFFLPEPAFTISKVKTTTVATVLLYHHIALHLQSRSSYIYRLYGIYVYDLTYISLSSLRSISKLINQGKKLLHIPGCGTNTVPEFPAD